MMQSQIFACLCLLFIASAYGFLRSPYNAVARPNGPRICSLPTNPCRLRVTLRALNGTYLNRIRTSTCTCNGGGQCSEDWSNRTHVVSRRLVSTEVKMKLQMMFCGPVQPKNICIGEQTALVVSGMGNYPTNIVSYDCQCRRERAMVLHERRLVYDVTHGYHQQHKYVCDYNKATCANHSSHCMVINETHTEYTCKCPRQTQCQPDTHAGYDENGVLFPVYGYCRPASAWP